MVAKKNNRQFTIENHSFVICVSPEEVLPLINDGDLAARQIRALLNAFPLIRYNIGGLSKRDNIPTRRHRRPARLKDIVSFTMHAAMLSFNCSMTSP